MRGGPRGGTPKVLWPPKPGEPGPRLGLDEGGGFREVVVQPSSNGAPVRTRRAKALGPQRPGRIRVKDAEMMLPADYIHRVHPTDVEDDCWTVNFQAQYHIQSKDVRKMHRAASKGKVARVQHILFMGENGLNETDKRNRTALHLACANGHAEVVTVLVERNCKLNLYDNLERTPLIKAVQCQQEDCARILLDHGADPNVSDVYGNTALHYAACGERVTTVARLLEHTADIEEGFTPLLLAVSQRNYKMTEYLLSEGADVHAVDNYERTALMLAIENGSTDIVNLLQEDVDVLSQDTHGWTGAEYTHTRGFNMYKVDKGIKNSQNKRKSSPGSRGKYPCLETITEEDSLSDMTTAEKATKTSRAGCRAKYHHRKVRLT
ncbi:putative ankyrin repeat domain-containing protein 19 [Manis javanica]|nr:putative ankyrin repeat domain-containing protein 19 [Manis javanica]